jgi:stearoyl-CoA desaturase (delta-9 desaturase)
MKLSNLFSSSTLGVQLVFFLAVGMSVLGLLIYDTSLLTLVLILAGYFLYGCLGIVITFHRLLTHRSYQTYPYLEKIFSILGCLGGTGSSLAWVAIHINHHLKSDKEGDPHSPAHKGLNIFKLSYEQEIDASTKWRMRELVTDKFHQLLHRYYFLILGIWGMVLFLIGGLYLTIFFHWVPLVITVLMSNIVNYIGHKPNWFGAYRRYRLSDQSTNNWVWALPSWGETWHNNHHRHPKNFNCGEQWWEFDISAEIIKLIKKG